MSASADGTYGIAYCGEVGVGAGVFNIKDRILRGLDLGGSRYEGVVSDDPSTGGFEFAFSMFIPMGVFFVQGTSPQELPHMRSGITVAMPSDFGNGEPIKLTVPPGDVTVMISKISDDYAPWAFAEKITISLG